MTPRADLASSCRSISTRAPAAARAERLRASPTAADFDVEVIFVDDGSGDASWDRIVEIADGWPGRARPAG